MNRLGQGEGMGHTQETHSLLQYFRPNGFLASIQLALISDLLLIVIDVLKSQFTNYSKMTLRTRPVY